MKKKKIKDETLKNFYEIDNIMKNVYKCESLFCKDDKEWNRRICIIIYCFGQIQGLKNNEVKLLMEVKGVRYNRRNPILSKVKIQSIKFV